MAFLLKSKQLQGTGLLFETQCEKKKIVLISSRNLSYDGRDCQMLTMRDLTSYYQYRRVKTEAENLSFMNSTVSHEMMTPLNCVVFFSQRLVNCLQKQSDLHIAKTVHRTSKLLKNYMRDLLDRNLIERGRLEPHYECVDVEELLVDVIEMMDY